MDQAFFNWEISSAQYNAAYRAFWNAVNSTYCWDLDEDEAQAMILAYIPEGPASDIEPDDDDIAEAAEEPNNEQIAGGVDDIAEAAEEPNNEQIEEGVDNIVEAAEEPDTEEIEELMQAMDIEGDDHEENDDLDDSGGKRYCRRSRRRGNRETHASIRRRRRP